ncbi:MAG: hypothetical protein Q9162_004573 [Coniocarpon cinnabarinum]
MALSRPGRLAQFIVALLSLVDFGDAQEETVFGTFAFVRTGERTPLINQFTNITTLTAYGANQMSSLGNTFRQRYLNSNSSTSIPGISAGLIDQQQTYFLADDSQYALASAQSFIETLYPPYDPADDLTADLSNGTQDTYPLGGRQLPWIQTVGPNDARSIYVDGSAMCNAFQFNNDFVTTDGFASALADSRDFYSRVGSVLGDDTLPAEFYTWENAFGVYDYVSYLYNHDGNVRNELVNGTLVGDLQRLRAYSNLWQWGYWGYPQNTSISTVAGQTFAQAILRRMVNLLQEYGQQGQLNLFFGEFPAMLSFAALAQLPSASQDFYGMPNYASAMAFELFSPNMTSLTNVDNYDGLRVRFLYINGTDTIDNLMPQQFTIYPLFGSGVTDMDFGDFANAMNGFAMNDPGDWCTACGSWDVAPFCMAYNTTCINAINDKGSNANGFHGQLSPSLAGAIGAVVTLAVLCVVMVVLVGCCGMTVVQRNKKNQSTAFDPPNPGTGAPKGTPRGFRAVHRLPSDPDLTDNSPTSPRSKDAEGGVTFGNGDDSVMGHERVGSWELKAPKRVATTTHDDDEGWYVSGVGKEVHPRETL